MVAVAVVAALAHAIHVPYPILLVLVGLLLALIPGLPPVVLAPDLVFLLFLPPLVYFAGFQTSPRDIKAQLRSILSLAIGLVIATTLIVGAVAHALMPQLGWPVAFALGALLAATDPVAATALLRDIAAPRRVVTLLESESLLNDATALVAYQVAIAAATAVTFSLVDAGQRIVVVAFGGILIGLLIGAASAWLRRQLNDAPVEITISLLTPFAAYLTADRLGVSGVLATMTAGMFVGWFAPLISQSDTRMRTRSVWEFVVFALNGLVFVLIGLQLSTVVNGELDESLPDLLATSATVCLAVILVRLVWVFGAASLESLLGGTRPNWRETLVVGWSGLRGVVSLAIALALPLSTPDRGALLFIAFVVILVTLVGQGLTLPVITRVLRIGGDDVEERQELHARAVAARAAVSRIDELSEQWPAHLPLIDTLRLQYEHRATHLDERPEGSGADAAARSPGAEQELLEHRAIRHALIDAERDAVLQLRQHGEITDGVWGRIERDLDLEELRMEA
jgi:CPA1 family monovalent cation:H+ antiporter